ncbi:PAS domain-containing sensor histidine kinase [Spirosoma aerolatum]|uniref:PAS domain-containing sensor histidine kinase n=1 Tax=Spirosoma aerolatum TaxID=1211326 RepID=UPI0009ACB0D8|nr:ATP-binding protein [Spirosoma aerolatum]
MTEFNQPDFFPANPGQMAEQVGSDHLNSIFETAPVCIVSYRAIRNSAHEIVDFKPLRVNREAIAACGHTREAIMASTLLELFPLFRGSALLQDYLAVVLSGENRRSDHYIPGLGGWFNVSVSCIAPDELAVVFIDVNTRKEAELMRQQQAELLTQISQSMQMAVSSHVPIRDESGRIVDFEYIYFNEKAKDWLPVDWRTVLGQTVRTMQFTANVDQTIARLAHVVETGETDHFDAIIADGRIFYNIIARSGEGTVSTFIDVTKQRRAEQKILELKAISDQQAALLQSILDSSLTAIACYDAVLDERGSAVDFRFVLANQTTFDILNTTANELYGKTIVELNPALMGSAVLDTYISVYETGQSTIMERQAQERFFYVSIVKFGDGVLSSAIDITENQQYREQLEAANMALKQSNDNLQSFAYVASHDLQEPLRKIRSFGDLILNEYSPLLPETAQDMLRRMQAAAERMSNLIQDLLSLSRLTIQQATFDVVDLNQLLSEVLTDLETIVADTGAKVERSLLPSVPGNPLQLRQLFQNLLSNALKFRQPDRSPHVRIDLHQVNAQEVPTSSLPYTVTRENAPASLSTRIQAVHPAKTFYAITISDNGIGFDAERYGETIFGAFQRLHGRKGNFVGTGIGLAIAKKVVENHYGCIVADSREGEGASFTVYLPA